MINEYETDDFNYLITLSKNGKEFKIKVGRLDNRNDGSYFWL